MALGDERPLALKINHNNQLYAHDYAKPRPAQKSIPKSLECPRPEGFALHLGPEQDEVRRDGPPSF